MRKTIYIYGSLCVSIIFLLVWSCVDTDFLESKSQQENADFRLKEAKDFFEKQMEQYPLTARSLKDAGTSLTAGDFIPKWDKAIASSQSNLACYDIPIDTEFKYKAISVTYEHGRAVVKNANVYQKLLIVKDTKVKLLGQYILTLIPDKKYENKNKDRICDSFINCMGKGSFTGVAIYTIPQTDFIIRVNRYEGGIKMKSISLLNSKCKSQDKIALMKSILGGIQLRRGSSITTRNFEDYNNEDDWPFNNENDGQSNNEIDWQYRNDYWSIADGLYYDPKNETFLIDFDGDGKPESVWFPELEVNSNGAHFNPLPDPDPMPDGPESSGWGCSYCGSEGCGGSCRHDDSSSTDENSVLPDLKLTYNIDKYPGYLIKVRNCMTVAKSVLNEMLGNKTDKSSSANSLQLWQEISGKMTLVGDYKAVFYTINSHLSENRPILTGVDHSPGHTGNRDGTTDHWIVINGRGYDEEKNQYYYTYIETGRSKEQASSATSENNRLYYDAKNGTFKDHDVYNGKEYSLTQIRPNK